MVDLRFVAPDLRRLDEAGSEVVVCGVWKDQRPLTGLACLLDWRLAGRLSRLATSRSAYRDCGCGSCNVGGSRWVLARNAPPSPQVMN